VNRSKLPAKEAQNVPRKRIKSYSMGLQAPSHLDTQVPKKVEGERPIGDYIRTQEPEDLRLDQLDLFG